MVVEMKTGIAGARWSAAPGDLIEVDDATGRSLVEHGYAHQSSEESPVDPLLVQSQSNKNRKKK